MTTGTTKSMSADGESTADLGARARLELILGGQRSGKSRLAEHRGLAWLERAPEHRVSLVATAFAADAEMAAAGRMLA